jgi:hypothetical protein
MMTAGYTSGSTTGTTSTTDRDADGDASTGPATAYPSHARLRHRRGSNRPTRISRSAVRKWALLVPQLLSPYPPRLVGTLLYLSLRSLPSRRDLQVPSRYLLSYLTLGTDPSP